VLSIDHHLGIELPRPELQAHRERQPAPLQPGDRGVQAGVAGEGLAEGLGDPCQQRRGVGTLAHHEPENGWLSAAISRCYHAAVPDSPDLELLESLWALGLTAVRTVALAGDASSRRYFRVHLEGNASVVAALYPAGAQAQAARDVAVQRWAWRRGLPVPEPVAGRGCVVVSADLGSDDAEAALRTGRSDVLPGIRGCLAAFQATTWRDAPNQAFDAEFFRRELAGFEQHFLAAGDRTVPAYLDALAEALESHPYRLAHRDFHLNNLVPSGGRVWAIDYQDLRGGPDTYDAASLLYERAAPELVPDPGAWAEATAAECGWDGGWRRRLLECRAQRGLKVLGTFARLAGQRPGSGYAGWLAVAREQTAAALRSLAAPPSLLERLAVRHPAERL